ncbi:DUF6504 family protein [Planomonospora venezuelensis]|uniref:DUF6504 domain-containing protein n=1 Tax=Planomonospora venezuelensis TaxID=1999 RepID=A0A841CYP6_PLAVE|nr:hypothetical protein [Planomonospora venezuelensis]GIM99025.1 hypothetical protein Pve01_06840 [Planomonospora venezuelensis]
MSRLYGDPIEVWTREGEPIQFVWRDRLYAVRRIIDHWVVAREWWKVDDDDPGERRFWRVEASPGQRLGTYELRFDTTGAGWLLVRAWEC